jgi:hypothetical protein
MNENHDNFIKSIKVELDKSADNLDAETQSKLNQLRQKAISDRKSYRHSIFSIPVATALAGCLTIAIFINIPDEEVIPSNNLSSAVIDDMELLSNSEDLEFLENLEFYEWLNEYEPQV